MLNVCYSLHKSRLGTSYEYNNQVPIKSRMIILSNNHKNSHILKGTTHYSIMFSRQRSEHSVVGYVDTDYAINLDDKRSTICYVGLIRWKSMT